MSAGQYQIVLEQGATYSQVFEWRDESAALIDVTGMTAEMQLRRSYDSPDPMITLTDTGGIALGGVLGTVTVTLPSAFTADLSPEVRGVYDIILTASGGGAITRFLEGPFRVSPQVTR